MPNDGSGPGQQNGASGGDSSGKGSWGQVANYAQLGFIFPAATVVGWLVGAGLDKWLHTTWIYIVGLLLGILAGFAELIRAVTKSK